MYIYFLLKTYKTYTKKVHFTYVFIVIIIFLYKIGMVNSNGCVIHYHYILPCDLFVSADYYNCIW